MSLQPNLLYPTSTTNQECWAIIYLLWFFVLNCSVVSDYLWPLRLQQDRLPLSFTLSPEFAQVYVHWGNDALSSSSPAFFFFYIGPSHHQSFSESTLPIRWLKVSLGFKTYPAVYCVISWFPLGFIGADLLADQELCMCINAIVWKLCFQLRKALLIGQLSHAYDMVEKSISFDIDLVM